MPSDIATTDRNPELLDERPFLGIAVHLLSLFLGALIAGPVYLLSSHDFTRENARNALNWHLTVFVLFVAAIVTLGVSADELEFGANTMELSLLPAPLDTIGLLVSILLFFLTFLAVVLTLVFSIVATIKAIFGTAWPYPGAPDLVARLERGRR